jgi:signal transduction histidine kinase/CheY-like chemotaxis protein
MPADSSRNDSPRVFARRGSLLGRFRAAIALGLIVIGGWLYMTIESVVEIYTLAATIARYSDLQGLSREAQSALANAEGGLDRFTQTGLGYDLARHHEGRAALRTAVSALRNRIVTESIRGTAGRASAAEAVYRDAADRAIAAFEGDNPSRAREIRDLSVEPVAQGLGRLFDELHTAFSRSVTSAENGLEDARRRATFFILGLAVLLLLGLVVLMAELSRRVANPVGAAAAGMADLLEGRKPPRMPDTSPDEIGELGARFNQVRDLVAARERLLADRDIEASVNAVLSVAAMTNDLEGFSGQVLAKLMEVTGADAAVLYLPEGDALVPVRAIGGAPGAAGHEEARRAASEGRPLFVSAEAPSPTIHLWNGEVLPQGTAHIPLVHSGSTVGVLALAATTPFPARIRNAIGAIAPSLAVALANAAANARLAEQSRRLAEQNQLLEEQRARLAETARELQRASALKDKFLASVSHELRTPMTVILGFTGSLLRGAQGELAPRQRESLDRVQRNARHLLQLINDVLDISRIEAGRAEVFPEPVDLEARFAQLTADYGEIARRKGVLFRTTIAEGLATVETDPTKLTQILHNLVGNALKFTEQGSIEVRAETRGATRWALVVADTGVGIPDAEQQSIFEEFRQGEAAQQEGRGGSGLGLSIVRQVARLLGGRVQLESTEGRGSVFTVELPRDLPATSPLFPPDRDDREVGSTVLVIDDERDVRELLQYELVPFGVRVLEAPDGQAGLEIARREKPDAILLDIRMPGTDGWQTLRALQEDPATSGIPVLILSVVNESARGLSLGAFDFVVKPVNREVLVSALRRAGALPQVGPVLVVDDDADVRELLKRELSAARFDVRAAAGGREALAALEEQTPAAVVLDLLMPAPDGFEVLARLRERGEWREIPVIVVTAKDLTADERARLDESARRVIRKGADFRLLVQEVLRAVSSERPARVQA